VTRAILVVSGPPGAGKTTLARRLAETAEGRSVHLPTDAFYDAIRAGHIAPWLPESHGQNSVVTSAIVAAASAYADGGYWVIVDGVVGPWFVDRYREAAERLGVGIDYVVLRPERNVAVARARDRAQTPLAEYPPGLYESFADLGPLETHAVDVGTRDVDTLVRDVAARLPEGRFRLPPLA
jgi:adenylate kinase family enzyme